MWETKSQWMWANMCIDLYIVCPLFYWLPWPTPISSQLQYIPRNMHTVFALLCFVVVIHWLIFSLSIRLTSLALWQSNDCPNASKATLMNMDKYFMWIHYERLHSHNKAKHNKTVCIFLRIYCTSIFFGLVTTIAFISSPNVFGEQ